MVPSLLSLLIILLNLHVLIIFIATFKVVGTINQTLYTGVVAKELKQEVKTETSNKQLLYC